MLICINSWNWHWVKSVRIQSFSGPYFLAYGLNTERYKVSLRIQSECGKIQIRKTLNMDNFYTVWYTSFLSQVTSTLHSFFWYFINNLDQTQQWNLFMIKSSKSTSSKLQLEVRRLSASNLTVLNHWHIIQTNTQSSKVSVVPFGRVM